MLQSKSRCAARAAREFSFAYALAGIWEVTAATQSEQQKSWTDHVGLHRFTTTKFQGFHRIDKKRAPTGSGEFVAARGLRRQENWPSKNIGRECHFVPTFALRFRGREILWFRS